MNRRGFLGTLFGLAVAPAVVARVITAHKPKPKHKVYRNPHGDRLIGYKGAQFLEPGYVYAPYIPLTIVSVPITAKRRKLKAKWSCELEQTIQHFHG
jgi:hypothetical protein